MFRISSIFPMLVFRPRLCLFESLSFEVFPPSDALKTSTTQWKPAAVGSVSKILKSYQTTSTMLCGHQKCSGVAATHTPKSSSFSSVGLTFEDQHLRSPVASLTSSKLKPSDPQKIKLHNQDNRRSIWLHLKNEAHKSYVYIAHW